MGTIIEGIENSNRVDEREQYRRQIVDRLKKEIERVRKYQNCHNTIDSCIMVIPEVVLELVPELANLALRSGVHVCSHKEVFFVANMIAERYMHLKENLVMLESTNNCWTKPRKFFQTSRSNFPPLKNRSVQYNQHCKRSEAT